MRACCKIVDPIDPGKAARPLEVVPDLRGRRIGGQISVRRKNQTCRIPSITRARIGRLPSSVKCFVERGDRRADVALRQMVALEIAETDEIQAIQVEGIVLRELSAQHVSGGRQQRNRETGVRVTAQYRAERGSGNETHAYLRAGLLHLRHLRRGRKVGWVEVFDGNLLQHPVIGQLHREPKRFLGILTTGVGRPEGRDPRESATANESGHRDRDVG